MTEKKTKKKQVTKKKKPSKKSIKAKLKEALKPKEEAPKKHSKFDLETVKKICQEERDKRGGKYSNKFEQVTERILKRQNDKGLDKVLEDVNVKDSTDYNESVRLYLGSL